MIQKIKKIFDGELQIEDIRKITTYEYEIDTKGYNYYYGGYKLPMGTFELMFEYGLNNIRIMKSTRVKDSYLITIRFIVNIDEMEDKFERDKEWRERWNKITSSMKN